MQDASNDPPVALNPNLDLTGLRERFETTSRLQIKDAFHPDTAERLHQCLMNETPWMLAYNEGPEPKYLRHEQMASMTPQEQSAFTQQIFQGAAKGFQFVYLDFPVSGTAKVEGQRTFYTHDVLKFLNGEEFRELAVNVTGVTSEFDVDTHATCYQAGHFLTKHNDIGSNDVPRLVAYVIQMTKSWLPDWGGKTEFFDDNGNVIESVVPEFNTITMFKVPQPHSVTFVPPFCPGRRVAMTGWLYSDKNN